MGISVEIEVFPWRRCQTLVQNGEADMITTIPTAERCSYTVSTKTPLWIKRYHLYTRKDYPETGTMNSISSIEDIALHKFSAISYLGNSWSQDNLEQRGIPVIYATSVEGMYRMLTAKRGDMLIDDPVLVDPALKNFGYENIILMTSGVVAESSFHPMLGKKSIFIDRVDELDATLGEMWKDGTIEKILETYRTGR